MNYRLAEDGKTPIKMDAEEWAVWFETRPDPHIPDGNTMINGAQVSTVFLTFDHGWGTGPPVLWETMVFGGPLGDAQVRYTSFDEAVGGHVAMCEAVRAAQPESESDTDAPERIPGRRSIALHGRLID